MVMATSILLSASSYDDDTIAWYENTDGKADPTFGEKQEHCKPLLTGRVIGSTSADSRRRWRYGYCCLQVD